MPSLTLVPTSDCLGGYGIIDERLLPLIKQEKFYACTDGEGIAHDALEHCGASDGSFEDETMALGAMWYCRGFFGSLRKGGSYYSPEQAISITLGGDFDEHISQITLRRCPRLKRIPDIEDLEDGLREIAELTPKYMLDPSPDDKAYCLYWLRRGLRRAHHRFKSPYTAQRLFWALAKKVDPYAKYASSRAEEGVEWKALRVTWDIKTSDVRVKEIPYPEFY